MENTRTTKIQDCIKIVVDLQEEITNYAQKLQKVNCRLDETIEMLGYCDSKELRMWSAALGYVAGDAQLDLAKIEAQLVGIQSRAENINQFANLRVS